jgi:hypothetical protein
LDVLGGQIGEIIEDFGLRWQSAAATPLFDCGQISQSGVALRFPPQSKKFGCGFVALCLCAFALNSFQFQLEE